MNIIPLVLTAGVLPKLYTMSVSLPPSLSTTIDNIMTAGQIIGGAVAGVILVIAAIQLMLGGRNSVEMGKNRIIFLIIGLVLVTGCSVIKTFLTGLMAF